MTLQNTPFSGMPTTPAGGNFMGGTHREPVFLKDVVAVQRKTGPETIDHHDLQRSMDVMFAVEGNDLGAVCAPHMGQAHGTKENGVRSFADPERFLGQGHAAVQVVLCTRFLVRQVESYTDA